MNTASDTMRARSAPGLWFSLLVTAAVWGGGCFHDLSNFVPQDMEITSDYPLQDLDLGSFDTPAPADLSCEIHPVEGEAAYNTWKEAKPENGTVCKKGEFKKIPEEGNWVGLARKDDDDPLVTIDNTSASACIQLELKEEFFIRDVTVVARYFAKACTFSCDNPCEESEQPCCTEISTLSAYGSVSDELSAFKSLTPKAGKPGKDEYNDVVFKVDAPVRYLRFCRGDEPRSHLNIRIRYFSFTYLACQE